MRHLSWPTAKPGISLRSQSGQAVTEYILVLVVVVGIALGVLYQLNTAFKKYVQSYFGEYIACLLETGEMPSLGGGDGANGESCAASFEPFSLKNGRPLMASGDGGGKGGSGGKKFSKSASGSSRNSRINKNRSAMNGDRSGRDSSISASVGSDGKKPSVKKSGGIMSGTFKFRTARNRPDEVIRLNSRFITSDDKNKKDESATIKAVDGKKSGSSSPKKMALNLDAFRTKDRIIDADLNISAGDYLRYLIIFAILVGIFVFFGGQINQLRKSWEK